MEVGIQRWIHTAQYADAIAPYARCFTYTDRYGIRESINHPYMDEPPLADEVTLEELGLTPGTVMTYLYDFGDNWKFQVLLESIEPPDKKLKQSKLLEFHGKRPSQYGDEGDW